MISVLGNGNCFVEVSGLFWELNPKALVPVSREFLSHVPGLCAFCCNQQITIKILFCETISH